MTTNIAVNVKTEQTESTTVVAQPVKRSATQANDNSKRVKLWKETILQDSIHKFSDKAVTAKIDKSPFVIQSTLSSFKQLIASLQHLLDEFTFQIQTKEDGSKSLAIRVIMEDQTAALAVNWKGTTIKCNVQDEQQPLVKVSAALLYNTCNLKIPESHVTIFLDTDDQKLGLVVQYNRVNVELYVDTLLTEELPYVEDILDKSKFNVHVSLSLIQPFIIQQHKLKEIDIEICLLEQKATNTMFLCLLSTNNRAKMVIPFNLEQKSQNDVVEIKWDENNETTLSNIDMNNVNVLFGPKTYDIDKIKLFLDSLNTAMNPTVELSLCENGDDSPMVLQFADFLFLIADKVDDE